MALSIEETWETLRCQDNFGNLDLSDAIAFGHAVRRETLRQANEVLVDANSPTRDIALPSLETTIDNLRKEASKLL